MRIPRTTNTPPPYWVHCINEIRKLFGLCVLYMRMMSQAAMSRCAPLGLELSLSPCVAT